jgi:GntR family transcriptional regulator
MSINRTDPRPPYWQIAQHLRTAIYQRELAPGARLPSERELMDRYGVSNATVRRAIRMLQSEGLLDAEVGRGVFVRRRRSLIHVSSAYLTEGRSWRAELARQGQDGRQELLQVDVVTPEPEIVERLGLAEDDPVVVRRRLMYVDDEPVQIADSYYPQRLAQGTPVEKRTPIPGGSLQALNAQPHRVTEHITVRMPRPEESRMLQLAPGVPVIRMLRTVYDTTDIPVEVSETIFAGDRHELIYEFPLTPR